MVALASDKYKAVIVFLALCLASGIVMFHPSMEVKTKLYEAIVDKSVSYIELTEKYNIIERRGEIFVLEEKTSN
jgi:hypothetical protein